jgi:solute carrier family 25 carnitine/acylcarnitine transporter 20/29
MGFPLIAVPIINAVVFAVHELSRRCFGFNDENTMNLYEGTIYGGIAGLANTIIVTPVDLVKCRLQIQADNNNRKYTGILDCVRKVFKKEGFKGLYKGNVITILREVPAYAAQFGGYYYSKQILAKLRKKQVDELGMFDLIIAGGIGGMLCWQASYPQDVVKTIIQTDLENKYKSKFFDGGIWNCSKELYIKEGFSGFWKGYMPCMLGAFVANAAMFVVYEKTKHYLNKHYSFAHKNKGE